MSIGKSKMSTSGFLVAIASLLFSIACYYADLRNVPVIAPWMDWIADHLYSLLPILTRLAPAAKMFVSAASVGLAFFLLATVLSACFIPSSRIGDLEGQMRAIQRKRRPRTVKVE
jgi:hypothetical protein